MGCNNSIVKMATSQDHPSSTFQDNGEGEKQYIATMRTIRQDLEYCRNQVHQCKEQLDSLSDNVEKHQKDFDYISNSMAQLSTDIGKCEELANTTGTIKRKKKQS